MRTLASLQFRRTIHFSPPAHFAGRSGRLVYATHFVTASIATPVACLLVMSDRAPEKRSTFRKRVIRAGARTTGGACGKEPLRRRPATQLSGGRRLLGPLIPSSITDVRPAAA